MNWVSIKNEPLACVVSDLSYGMGDKTYVVYNKKTCEYSLAQFLIHSVDYECPRYHDAHNWYFQGEDNIDPTHYKLLDKPNNQVRAALKAEAHEM